MGSFSDPLMVRPPERTAISPLGGQMATGKMISRFSSGNGGSHAADSREPAERLLEFRIVVGNEWPITQQLLFGGNNRIPLSAVN